MEQLKMRWTNDRKPAPELNIPDGCEIKRFTELDGALDAWLDIVTPVKRKNTEKL